MKFRKKPVMIDAFQLRSGETLPDWFCTALLEGRVRFPNSYIDGDGAVANAPAFIQTLEGEMRADDGDWIIRGVKGEIYPVKDEIFMATYEAVVE